MDIQVDAIQATTEMPECISVVEIQQASSINNHLQQLKGIIITGWPDSRDELHSDLQPYWPYRDELAVIDGIILKGKHILITNSLKEQVLISNAQITWAYKKQSYWPMTVYTGPA